jgi:hypothetical protein
VNTGEVFCEVHDGRLAQRAQLEGQSFLFVFAVSFFALLPGEQ